MGDRGRHWFRGNRRRRGSPGGCDGPKSHGIDDTTLSGVPDGSVAIVTGYYGGEGVRRKAMDLGLVPGAQVVVLMRGAGRLLVVRVGETRIMIGHGVAGHVRVLVKE